MPKIDFNEYQKSVNPPEGSETTTKTVNVVKVTDTQYFIQEDNVLLDFIDLDFKGEGLGVEVWMSFLGGSFKMRCSMVPKKVLEEFDLDDYIRYLLDEFLPCLKCKTNLLFEICESEKDDDDDEEEDDEIEDEKA